MPDPTLQGTALRYAAGDLTPDEVAAFEARLAEDQDARDALAEAVRLSAAAIGQPPLTPHPSFRAAIRDRLNLRAYRGHPFAWVGLGAAAVAACTIIALSLAERDGSEPAPTPARVEVAPQPREAEAPDVAVAPMPREAGSPVAAELPNTGACGEDGRSVAEIWADLSTAEHVEKAHDDEFRRRQYVRNLYTPHVTTTAKAAATADNPQP